jgi:hypothetical protein
MMKQTRYFVVGAAVFLVAGLSVGLVAYYGGFPGLALSSQGPDDLRFVPADAAVVAYANVHDIMNSDFRKQMKALEPSGAQQGQQEFRDQTGIDIETDIESVLAYMLPGDEGQKQGVVLARGHFNRDKIGTLLTSHGATTEEFEGTKVYSHPQAGKNGPGGLAFLGESLVAVGSTDSVKRTIHEMTSGGQGNVIGNREVMDLIHSVQGNSNAWAVGRFDVLAGQAKLPSQVTSQMPPVKYFAAAGHVNGGVSGSVSMEATDEAAATNLAKIVDGFMALAQMQFGSKPEAQKLIQQLNLRTTKEDRRVAISFSISPELLGIMQQMASHKGAALPSQPPVPPAPPAPPVPAK